MDTIFLGVIALCMLVIVIVLILILGEIKRTCVSMRKTAEESVKPALEEIQMTLKSVNGVSDNVIGITSNVKDFSQSLARMGHAVGAINSLVENIGSSATIRAFSLKAGIMAAMEYLARNFMRKGEKNERRGL